MNTLGELFQLTTFGESHGPALGAVIDGCPAGVPLSAEMVQHSLNRRRPGASQLASGRAEPDTVELLSGVYDGKTLGTPIAALVRNVDARSQDYEGSRRARPGHADEVWKKRYRHVDVRGGGRTSGRETVGRVIGGAVAEAMLGRELPALSTVGWVSQVGSLVMPFPQQPVTRPEVDASSTRCPEPQLAAQMEALILEAKGAGDSLGGVVTVRVDGLPVGLGEPVFGKLKALLAHALASIGAVAGVTWGPESLGELLKAPGSRFHAVPTGGRASEVYGGIQGGLSNGAPLVLQILFKPPATLGELAQNGRHDPCILPRAVPVVEAMVSLVLADAWLLFLARPHRP